MAFARTRGHDQKSHGRKGSGGGLKGKRKLKDAYEFTDSVTGFRTEIDRIGKVQDDELYPGRKGWTEVDVIVTDKDGNDIGQGTVQVSPDGKAVHHVELTLDQGVQGQGFATRSLMRTLETYRENGVEQMTLTANADVGGYAWARAGMDFANPASRAALEDHVVRAFEGSDRRIAQELDRVMDNPNSTPADFAMVGHSPGATSWTGKEIMLGSTWEADASHLLDED